MDSVLLNTGQNGCYSMDGLKIPCSGTGQDADYKKGVPWPVPRFKQSNGLVTDLFTGLVWCKNANIAEFPLTWQESLAFIIDLNNETFLGCNDWRLPNRRELRSLMSYQARKPALPEGHPFQNVFLGWYWTSTTAAINPAYAWYVHMEGARMFYGNKDQYYLLWPVRGENDMLLQTGQRQCFDRHGNIIPCRSTGQDGELLKGMSWPEPRFTAGKETVIDHLTGLCWLRNADLVGKFVNWSDALQVVNNMNTTGTAGIEGWRLPNINELESIVDCSRSNPALPKDHPFENLREVYWSSTTSLYEPSWAWALYLHKGACGVGFKKGSTFHVWPVCDR